MRKILAIVGTYRKGKNIDTAVTEVLNAAKSAGVQTEKIYLIDKDIKYCTNCRACTQKSIDGRRGTCSIHKDDMESILKKIDEADALVLASPINFFTVTAVMKTFVERLVVYAYWPWGTPAPKTQQIAMTKRSIVIVSSACPAFIARFIMPNCRSILKTISKILGAKVLKSFHFGKVSLEDDVLLTKSDIEKLKVYGQRLITD